MNLRIIPVAGAFKQYYRAIKMMLASSLTGKRLIAIMQIDKISSGYYNVITK